ncbi:hypothetical protein M9458_050872, partial [Cirrhinus mrigala]
MMQDKRVLELQCVFLVFVNVLCFEALSVSAAALFSADLWRLSRTALPAQLLLSTGGAGELDTGRLRGHRGGSDQRRDRSSVLTLSKARWEKGELYVCKASFHK